MRYAPSLSRLGALVFKELVQMRRDRLTFALMIGMPLMQLILFGYAINTDPRHMPTIVEQRADGPLVRSFLAGLRQSSYFDIRGVTTDPQQAEDALRSGRASFLISIPEGFEARLMRGEVPQILIAADATDPVAAGGATRAVREIAARALSRDLSLMLGKAAEADPFEVVVHLRYNPEGRTAINIVPGLLGIILTMTMVMITSIALTREAERGTLETLLASPLRPHEVMIGKTVPYLIVAAVQIVLTLAAGAFLFDIPFEGSGFALALGLALFVAVNLLIGFLISTVARTQMQAMQMTFFFFLPTILLSGFMFPFAAMPLWARMTGEALPITHFLRIVRGVMLKGAGLADIREELFWLSALLGVVAAIALLRYRRTLD